MGVFAYHTYGKDSFAEKIARVRAFTKARVWLTEYGDLNDEDFTDANEWKNFSVLATRRVLDALNDGVNGAMFWDAYDNFHEHDQRMTWYGLLKNRNHRYTPKKRYYAAKHVYRFVRPGAVRIALEGVPKGLTAAAFLDEKAGRVVIVGLKEKGTPELSLTEPEGTKIREWQVWETTSAKNCERTATLPGGATRLALESESIFTVVGEIEK
jgi:O-glycosyl hydrolase